MKKAVPWSRGFDGLAAFEAPRFSGRLDAFHRDSVFFRVLDGLKARLREPKKEILFWYALVPYCFKHFERVV